MEFDRNEALSSSMAGREVALEALRRWELTGVERIVKMNAILERGIVRGGRLIL